MFTPQQYFQHLDRVRMPRGEKRKKLSPAELTRLPELPDGTGHSVVTKLVKLRSNVALSVPDSIVPNVSSSCTSEDETKKRSSSKKRPKSNTLICDQTPVPTFNGLQQQGALQADVGVMDFADFFREHPDCFKHFEKDSVNSKFATFASRQNKDPFKSRLFQDHIRNIPKPMFSLPLLHPYGMSHSSVHEQLTQRRLRLPLLEKEYQANLLIAAGVNFKGGREVTLPPCSQGASCYGRIADIRGKDKVNGGSGATLCKFMYPQELKDLMENGTASLLPAPCILCMRYEHCCIVLSQRFFRSRLESTEEFGFQCFRSRIGPNGYKESYALFPLEGHAEGFYDPLIRLQRHALHWKKDCTSGQWVIDESEMYHVEIPTLLPYTGETLTDFRRRSDAHYNHLLRYSLNICTQRSAPEQSSVLSYDEALRIDAELAPRGVICEHTIVSAYADIYSIPMAYGLEDRPHFISHLSRLFAKCWLFRCATRKMDTVIGSCRKPDEGFLNLPEYAVARSHAEDMVVCSLLGNYEHLTQSDRMSMLHATNRKLLYDARLHALPIRQMLQRVPMLLAFCIRQYLSVMIEADMALKHSCSSLFDWTDFRFIVESVLTRCREVLSMHLKKLPSWPAKDTPEWESCMQDIHFVCNDGHDTILRVFYQKPYPSIEQEMHNLKYKSERALPVVSECHVKALARMISLMHPAVHSWEHDILPYLGFFGCSEEGICDIQQFHEMYTKQHAGVARLVLRLSHLVSAHAYDFAVCLKSCMLWTKHQEVVSYPLPLHMLVAQLKAIRHRYGASQEASDLRVPDYDAYLYYCSQCLDVYSIVVESIGKCKRHNISDCRLCYKPYSHGFEDAPCDHNSGELFCSRYHGPPCELEVCNTRLNKVLILGQVVKIKKKWFTVCTGCGHKTILDPRSCGYTTNGYTCVNCERASKEERIRDIQSYELSQNAIFECALCGQVPRQHADIVCYPCNVFVCKKHNSDEYPCKIDAALARIPDEEHCKEIIVSLLLSYRTAHRAEMFERFKKVNAIRLARGKRLSRAGGRR